MNESVKPKPAAPVERLPAVDRLPTVDSIVRKMTREHEAAGELAAGLREVLKGDPVAENAKHVTKGVETLQIVASVLFQDHDRGGTGGAKTALQEHLTELKAMSSKCAARIDFASEAEQHEAAFKLCKLLELTPRLLASAMNVSFEVLVDLNSRQAQSAAPHKKALLLILRNFGAAYSEISSVIQVPDLTLPNSETIKKRIWTGYRWLTGILWLVWVARMVRGPASFLGAGFYGVLIYVLGAVALSKLMPVIEHVTWQFHRRRLQELGIFPDKKGKYRIQPNGFLFETDYVVIKSLLSARGHDWDDFQQD